MDGKYLAHLLKNIPDKPGVYKMKDKDGKIIYIGKAKSLNKRVKSYFQKTGKDSKTEKLVANIEDIDYSVVNTELEAIMLETNLIKQYRPKYNILMKDDKNFVYVKITVNEDFPRVLITRKVEKDKAKYFGPKTAQHKVIKTLKVLKRIFPYRHCNLGIEDLGGGKVKITHKTIKFPCIDYHIKRCAAPCIAAVTVKEYKEIIEKIVGFFEGRYDEIINTLKEEMTRAANEKKFEKAASIRDRLTTIEDIMEKQEISAPDLRNMDIINYYKPSNHIYFTLFQVRGGKLINQENFELKSALEDENAIDKEALSAFIIQYFEKATDFPDEILIPHETDDLKELTEFTSGLKGKKIEISVPQKGHKNKLLDLCFENAKNFAKLSEIKWQGHAKTEREQALEQLASILGMENPPKRLECYDVSHLGGTSTVSSMVVFENGFPKKSDYRKFRLSQNTAGKPDDYASMEETIQRRLKHLKPSIETAEIKILKLKPAIAPKVKKDSKVTKAEKKKKKPPKSDLTEKHYQIVFKGNKIGTVEIVQNKSNKSLIKTLEIKKEGQDLSLRPFIKKIAEKCKTKRIYVSANPENTALLEKAGCELIRKIPDHFEPSSPKDTVMVFDLMKKYSDSSFSKKPDLIIVDGGKGQLNIAQNVIDRYKLKLPLISIAKKNEEIFIPGRKKEVILAKDSPALRMIQHIRDESHRFAVSYQTGLHLKASKTSTLDEIPGIGSATKAKLLKHFGSPENIRNSTLYELEKIAGKKNAIKIKEHFLKT